MQGLRFGFEGSGLKEAECSDCVPTNTEVLAQAQQECRTERGREEARGAEHDAGGTEECGRKEATQERMKERSRRDTVEKTHRNGLGTAREEGKEGGRKEGREIKRGRG